MPSSWQLEPPAFLLWAFTLIITIVHRSWHRNGGQGLTATQNSVSPSSPPATKFKRKALLIGIERYPSASHEPGKCPERTHCDVLGMRRLLIDVYHYDPLDITMLIDNDKPDQVQPTRANVIQKIKDLIDGARQGDQFVFHYTSHATQAVSDDMKEKDGMDELIITSDGETIHDDELFQLLAKPLPIGSTLVIMLDCSHSGSLSDLCHSHCNAVYVPWLDKGTRKTAPLYNDVVRKNAYISSQVTQAPIPHRVNSMTAEWYGTPETPIPRCDSPPNLIFCDGKCREAIILQHEIQFDADIICLSSAKAGQLSWKIGPYGPMTQILLKILEKNPSPSLKDLLTDISHGLQTHFLSMPILAQEYKQYVKDANKRRVQLGLSNKYAEMDNFQEPQISSSLPLDMTRQWHL